MMTTSSLHTRSSSLSHHPATIRIEGLREHNLKNLTFDIPKHQLVVITGVSGSGKSSLAFDTLFAEGQRRYLDSMNAYAKAMVGQMPHAKVTHIEGLTPTIAIDQKTVLSSKRSTVGTSTEILDALRVLFARIGTAHCPECHTPIYSQTPSQVVEVIQQWPSKTRLHVMSPVVRGRKGDYAAFFQQWKRQGYSRAMVDGEMVILDELPDTFKLARHKTHHISLVIDRVIIPEVYDEASLQRLSLGVEKAFELSHGYIEILKHTPQEEAKLHSFSLALSCPNHPELHVPEMAPRLFSFNSPYGACTTCHGSGEVSHFHEYGLVKHPHLSLKEGCIPGLKLLLGGYDTAFLEALTQYYGVATDMPWEQLPLDERSFLLKGEKSQRLTKHDASLKPTKTLDGWRELVHHFDGFIPALERRWQALSEHDKAEREKLEAFQHTHACPSCKGKRLKPFALATTLKGKSIYEIGEMSLERLYDWVQTLPQQLNATEAHIAQQALEEMTHRLHFINQVGLGYLTLNRPSRTLSGGESQRIRLASQLGSGLSGVTYILDEPSIGLHSHNTHQLIDTLKALRDQGNSVIVVEHDEDMIRAADWVIDIGPRAGIHGGYLMTQGTPEALIGTAPSSEASSFAETSLTQAYLSGMRRVTIAPGPIEAPTQWLTLYGITHHNLKDLTVSLPLQRLGVLSGMSGSGKSSLLFGVIYPLVEGYFKRKPAHVAPELLTRCTHVEGLEHLAGMIHIDQSPIGKTSRSNPATYMGIWDIIRKIFAHTEGSKKRGWQQNRFSFNVKGGRCETCKGQGVIEVEMTFLPHAYTPCPSCHGKRFTRETLQVTYQGKHIAEMLDMTIGEACEFFGNQHPTLKHLLQTLVDVGLSYISLGQPSNTLSGGECQRLKLASELCRKPKGHWLYLLDEPSVGLHWDDLQKLMSLFRALVQKGHSVWIIEHHPDVIRLADYCIDMGPFAGEQGGKVIAQGPPHVLKETPTSLTGRYLA
ncbi:MAG: excinuclease ABC subunit UvrA [Vampirovibrionales bacterium]